MLKILEIHGMKERLREVEAYLEQALHFEHAAIREKALKTLHAGGKRVRPALAIMTAGMYGKEKEIIPLAAVLEMVHMASLIHDDVVDQADTRRGQATVNAEKGNRYAVHIGDYVLMKAIDIIRTLPNSTRLLQIMAELSIEMSLGEVEQLRSTFDVNQTIDDYKYRIDRKTAILMASSCQAAAVACGATEEDINTFYQIGYNLGMEFQIQDDILDMSRDSKKLGKPAGSDLAHGIMTLPTILVLQKEFAERDELISSIENRFPGGQNEVNRAIAIIKEQGGLQEADIYGEGYLAQAVVYIEQLPDAKLKKQLMSGVKFLRERAF